jgi:RIO-like serine/threonine protein kinase fused to N-terminal HTH domain
MKEPLRIERVGFDSGAILYDAAVIETPQRSMFNPKDPMLQAQPVAEGGRNAAWYVKVCGRDAVLRQYRRGGFVSRISKTRYIWAGEHQVRSFTEFDILEGLYQAGLPVPRPFAAAYWRLGPTYRAGIITERLHNVRPLATSLHVADCEQVARSIYAMHEHGVWHSDLNAYNVLLDEDGRAWLIDFDKAHRVELSLERRSSNLLRLRRSLAKVAGTEGIAWWDGLNRSYAKLIRTLAM